MPIQCFIIMPFADEFLPIRDAIRDAVESASDGGRAIRADDIFRPGNVVAQVQDAIRAADFCVADVTGDNRSVMWEAGLASALGESMMASGRMPNGLPSTCGSTRSSSTTRAARRPSHS